MRELKTIEVNYWFIEILMISCCCQWGRNKLRSLGAWILWKIKLVGIYWSNTWEKTWKESTNYLPAHFFVYSLIVTCLLTRPNNCVYGRPEGKHSQFVSAAHNEYVTFHVVRHNALTRLILEISMPDTLSNKLSTMYSSLKVKCFLFQVRLFWLAAIEAFKM